MLDLIIKGGTVIDGTGTPGVRADVAVRDGRVVAVGALDEPAAHTIDAAGLFVTPGFVDPHTHYDAQLFWDPLASPSNDHGVTSVIAGNCGFTLAPLKARDADYTRRMMAKVEGMALPALENGLDWNWETFAQYLDRLDGHTAVNAGFLVGHCALRRYVMGADSVGSAASAEQVAAMVHELSLALAAGGLGFSTTLSKTHTDADGKPVPSRWSTHDEVLALCAAVRDHEGTTLEAIIDGCLDGFTETEIDLFTRMSVAAQRPLNWNVLTADSKEPDRAANQLAASDYAAARGGRIVALTMPILVPMNMSFLNFCGLWLLPDWQPILSVPVPERMARLRDPETRARLLARSQAPEAGVFRRLTDWANYVLGDTYAESTRTLRGRLVGDVAAERGASAWDTLLGIVLEDDLRTILWPRPTDGDGASWDLRARLWQDERVMIGGSDAGAHLDRMCGAPYPTRFIGDMLRGRRLIPVEKAVQLMSDAPARLFGLRDRGRVAAGYHADLVLFDPETVGAEAATLVHDLPGNSPRLTASAVGVHRVMVNGVATVVDGKATGDLPGRVLRSGRDTYTVTP